MTYDQPIIEAEIVESTGSLQLRNSNNVEDDDYEDFNASEVFRKNYTIDMDFVNQFQSDPQSESTTPRQESHNMNGPDPQNSPVDIGDVELSSPNPDNVTSTQKEDLNELKDFGVFNENADQNDDEYILNRLTCMSNSYYIEPIRFMADKSSLQRIYEKAGLVDGYGLDYIGHIIHEEASNTSDCSFLKTQFSLWLTYPVKTRANWTTNLIADEESFIQAKRIILPWNKAGNHWIVLHFDSTRKIIENFDSLHGPSNLSDIKRITNFLRVCIS